jgi:hypothetical protein
MGHDAARCLDGKRRCGQLGLVKELPAFVRHLAMGQLTWDALELKWELIDWHQRDHDTATKKVVAQAVWQRRTFGSLRSHVLKQDGCCVDKKTSRAKLFNPG